MSVSLHAYHATQLRERVDIAAEHKPAPVPCLPTAKPRPTVKLGRILKAVSAHSGQSEEALVGRRRDRGVVRARWLYMLLAYELTGASLPQIARVIHRDHTTVLHGIKRAKEFLPHDAEYQQIYEKARARLTG